MRSSVVLKHDDPLCFAKHFSDIFGSDFGSRLEAGGCRKNKGVQVSIYKVAQGPWPMWGLPELLQLDNAAEFHSRALVRGAQEYGIRIDYRPPGTPHFGGHIERLIGTTMGAVHLLPGTTFSNVAEKGDYPSKKTSALTLVELERWLALQVGGVYHQSVHSSLLKPPAAAWEEGLARRRQAPRKPADAQTFFLDFLPEERRLIRRARHSNVQH